MQMNAAVFRKTHEPLTIEAVEIDKPLGREVLVRTAASGVCHSDLHVVDGLGRWPLDRPIVLGHEGAGVVEAVGADVTTLRPGDHVVACLSGFCGACAQCLAGHPNLCVGGLVARPDSAPPRLSQRGQALRQFIGISSYAEHMLLHENSVVKIDADLPLDRAALVGCGVLTGVGAALRTSGLEAGQTVAVFGCGGVGLAIIQGARIGGARQIIAIDRGQDDVAETHQRDRARRIRRFIRIEPAARISRVHRAEAAGASADRAQQHQCRRARIPALADVRAVRLLADRVQAMIADDIANGVEAPTGRHRSAQPAWLGAGDRRFSAGRALDSIPDRRESLRSTVLLAGRHRRVLHSERNSF